MMITRPRAPPIGPPSPNAPPTRLRDKPVDVLPARHVGVDLDSALAEQRLGRLAALPRFADDVADDDARPFVGEAERNRPPDPRAPSGDDGDPVSQTHASEPYGFGVSGGLG